MNKKGFTLIEMLIVVAIIGLLASVVVLGLGGARESARDAKRAADIKQIANGAEAGNTNPGGYPALLNLIDGAPQQGPSGASDPYVYEAVDANGDNINEGFRVGACGETTKFAAGANFCPTAGFTCAAGQEICAGAL